MVQIYKPGVFLNRNFLVEPSETMTDASERNTVDMCSNLTHLPKQDKKPKGFGNISCAIKLIAIKI